MNKTRLAPSIARTSQRTNFLTNRVAEPLRNLPFDIKSPDNVNQFKNAYTVQDSERYYREIAEIHSQRRDRDKIDSIGETEQRIFLRFFGCLSFIKKIENILNIRILGCFIYVSIRFLMTIPKILLFLVCHI